MLITLPPKNSFTIAETARLLGVSRTTVYSLLSYGSLQAWRLGQKCGLRIPRESLADYLESHRHDPAA